MSEYCLLKFAERCTSCYPDGYIWIGQDGGEGGGVERKFFSHTLLKDVEQITQQNNIGLHSSLCERRLKFDDFIKFRLKYARTRSGERARKLPAQLVYGLRGPPSTPLHRRNRSTVRSVATHNTRKIIIVY